MERYNADLMVPLGQFLVIMFHLFPGLVTTESGDQGAACLASVFHHPIHKQGFAIFDQPGDHTRTHTNMTRGNQRELARQKNAKKQAEMKKGRDIPEGLSVNAVKLMYARESCPLPIII